MVLIGSVRLIFAFGAMELGLEARQLAVWAWQSCAIVGGGVMGGYL